MATVYSLICWGGRTGKTVTASNSSGLIFTTSGAHGLRDGTALQFVATTLPGNVSAGTTYYAKSLTSTTFAIYTDYALTNRVAWSSAGSAVIAPLCPSITPPIGVLGEVVEHQAGFRRVRAGLRAGRVDPPGRAGGILRVRFGVVEVERVRRHVACVVRRACRDPGR